MVDISIVDGGYKLTYNWGVPRCIVKRACKQTYHLRGTLYLVRVPFAEQEWRGAVPAAVHCVFMFNSTYIVHI